MRYDRDDVLAGVDLAGLADTLIGPRHPRTGTWTCPNPGHAQTGRTPPLTIFTDRRGGERWHCHGCGDGGTAIDLVLRTGRAHDFRDALEWLADQANVSPSTAVRFRRRPPVARRDADPATRSQLNDYMAGCVAYLHSSSPGGRRVLRWLVERRGIPAAVLAAAGVGADPGRRHLPRPKGIPAVYPAAVFPVRSGGDVVFTQSRHLDPPPDWPRWRNTASYLAPNPRMAVYHPRGSAAGGPIVVTEGALDALSVLAAGQRAVALLGVDAADPTVSDRLVGLGGRLVLATDNDAAGRLAERRVRSLLADRGVASRSLSIPECFKDLNEWHVNCQEDWARALRSSLRLALAGGRRGLSPPSVA